MSEYLNINIDSDVFLFKLVPKQLESGITYIKSVFTSKTLGAKFRSRKKPVVRTAIAKVASIVMVKLAEMINDNVDRFINTMFYNMLIYQISMFLL